MKKITLKEFVAFIHAQPDERPLDMIQSHIGDPCGCVMIQYGREHGIPVKYVGSMTFFGKNKGEDESRGVAALEAGVDTLAYAQKYERFWKSKNYGELKACLKKKYNKDNYPEVEK